MHSVVILGDSRYHEVSVAPKEDWGAATSPPSFLPGFFGGTRFHCDAVTLGANQQLKTYTYEWPKTLRDTTGSGFAETNRWQLKPVELRRGAPKQGRLYFTSKVETGTKNLFPSLSATLVTKLTTSDGEFEPTIPEIACLLPIANKLHELYLSLGELSPDDLLKTLRKNKTLLSHNIELMRLLESQTSADADALEQFVKSIDGRSAAKAKELFRSLSEKSSKHSQLCQVSTCPDIILIDDLNLGFRRLPIPRTIDAESIKNAQKQLKLNASDLASALILLIDRFRKAENKSKEYLGLPIMEPILIASIVDAPDTAFDPIVDDKENKLETFWSHLYNSTWLRERCIILLDVADLRTRELVISSGLSWERTAQDLISELNRSPRFRRFLEFGQVIVRFGLHGVLHIVRRGPRDISYKLIFDTTSDDASGPDLITHGSVLGASAVFSGTLVEELVSHCNARLGNPLLPDLPSVVLKAAPKALSRIQRLNDFSYCHSDWSDYVKLLESGYMLPEKLFESDASASSTLFSEVSVPPVLLSDWSILGQTVQNQVGVVAREIVRFGIEDVLNQHPLNDKRGIAQQWVSIVIDNIENKLNALESERLTDDELKSRAKRMIRDAMDSSYDSKELLGSHSVYFKREVIPDATRLEWRQFVDGIEPDVVSLLRESTGKRDYTALRNKALTNAVDQVVMSLRVSNNNNIIEPVAAPVARYGAKGQESFVVDRREIEGYRAVEKLMKAHIQNAIRPNRPLSIAVFGPPGSGKSTAVKRIRESLGSGNTKIIGSFNLSQFRTESELKGAFEKIRDDGKGTIPIAFFDEFDCVAPDGKEHGWLKYFLAPMEDRFYQKVDVTNAIFVFAGGTKTTFNDFSLTGRSRDDEQWVKFSQAKGPDFVSRLRGHLNIVGINPADANDDLYLIRRAIMIRNVVAEMQSLHEGEWAKIDENLLRAVLHVPIYLHGGRALRMLLEQCSSRGRISAYEVPPIQQLNMLVDGKAFLDLLYNVQSADMPLPNDRTGLQYTGYR